MGGSEAHSSCRIADGKQLERVLKRGLNWVAVKCSLELEPALRADHEDHISSRWRPRSLAAAVVIAIAVLVWPLGVISRWANRAYGLVPHSGGLPPPTSAFPPDGRGPGQAPPSRLGARVAVE